MTGPILSGRSMDDYPLNSPTELRAHLAKDFANWQLPDRVEFMAAIPCTATGKFKKTQLHRHFA